MGFRGNLECMEFFVIVIILPVFLWNGKQDYGSGIWMFRRVMVVLSIFGRIMVLFLFNRHFNV